VRVAQRGLTGCTRALLNNAGISSGPQIVIASEFLEPADGVMEITPLKIWRAKAGQGRLDDVRKAFMSIKIESRQEELLNIIRFFIELADRAPRCRSSSRGSRA
jgi:hypothetical protein